MNNNMNSIGINSLLQINGQKYSVIGKALYSGGPHASNTGDLGGFKILKEESSSAGVRRIKAVIGNAAK
jgi:alanyl-tRNA synthetase